MTSKGYEVKIDFSTRCNYTGEGLCWCEYCGMELDRGDTAWQDDDYWDGYFCSKGCATKYWIAEENESIARQVALDNDPNYRDHVLRHAP